MTAPFFVDRQGSSMSIFTDGINLSIEPAMDQMAETIWINGSVPIKGISDPVEQSTRRSIAGRVQEIACVIFLKKGDVSHYNVKKGDRVSFEHSGSVVGGRVIAIEDDGSSLMSLTCGPLTKGVIPG
jgi:hypothetical protein